MVCENMMQAVILTLKGAISGFNYYAWWKTYVESIRPATRRLTGVAVISRQFREMTGSRIEALLASFPKLITSGSQHTFVETDAVRFVYQPLEDLYMILITTKNSNILQDIDSLHLFARAVSDRCHSLDEQEILLSCFEILEAFDEIVSMGYRENVTLSQVRTMLEMDSHEERIHEIIERNKELEAKEELKRRARQLEMQRRDASRRSNAGFGSDVGSVSRTYDATPTAPVYGMQDSMAQTTAPTTPLKGKGMQLGKKPKGSAILGSVQKSAPGSASVTPKPAVAPAQGPASKARAAARPAHVSKPPSRPTNKPAPAPAQVSIPQSGNGRPVGGSQTLFSAPATEKKAESPVQKQEPGVTEAALIDSVEDVPHESTVKLPNLMDQPVTEESAMQETLVAQDTPNQESKSVVTHPTWEMATHDPEQLGTSNTEFKEQDSHEHRTYSDFHQEPSVNNREDEYGVTEHGTEQTFDPEGVQGFEDPLSEQPARVEDAYLQEDPYQLQENSNSQYAFPPVEAPQPEQDYPPEQHYYAEEAYKQEDYNPEEAHQAGHDLNLEQGHSAEDTFGFEELHQPKETLGSEEEFQPEDAHQYEDIHQPTETSQPNNLYPHEETQPAEEPCEPGVQMKSESADQSVSVASAQHDQPQLVTMASSIPDSSNEPAPAQPLDAMPAEKHAVENVHLTVKERVSVTGNRDGGLESLEIKGDLLLKITDPSATRLSILMNASEQFGGTEVQYRTHPHVDKQPWSAERKIALRDPKREFPLNQQVGVLRWRCVTKDESALPLSIAVWVSPSGDGACDVNIEYQLENSSLELTDVVIAVPVPSGTQPDISEPEVGSCEIDSSNNMVVWRTAAISNANASASLEFSVSSGADSVDVFFPVSVDFSAHSALLPLEVLNVLDAPTGTPRHFSHEAVLVADNYLIH